MSRILVLLSMCLPLAAATIAAEEAPPAPLQHPSLLGTRWGFEDGKLDAWRHKNNAALSIAEEEGSKALRLESGFAPFEFTWTTRHFEPHTLQGVVHVTFRVRGDKSGHKLRAMLGAPRPEGGKSLYYINDEQAITLDFTGWRDVSLDLAHFRTPAGARRDRDFENVIFLELMVLAHDDSAPEKKPCDVWIDDVVFTGYTPEEEAANRRREEERRRIVAETCKAVERIKAGLVELDSKLDEAEEAGRYVAVARVYCAALEWCADDVQRLLEAEEFELVARAPALAEDLARRVADSKAVLDRVRAAAPEEKDALDPENNPYFKSVTKAARGWSKTERSWPKGRAGYVAVPNAWSFRSFGDSSYDLVWSMTRPKSPLRHDPMLARNLLNLFDLIAHQHERGDFNIDREAVHGRDPNINRFCLAPTLDAWREMDEAYPNLLPPAKRADLLAGLKVLADYQVTDYGRARLAKKPHVEQPAYPNMDVHHILIMELAHRLWGDAVFAEERDVFVEILDSATYPGGAWAYINTQNECFVYHKINVIYSARFWQLTGNPTTLAMLRRTIPFYPYNVEPAGVPEYYTDPCWKHYWSRADAEGPDTIAGLFDDPLNKRVAEICGEVFGHGHGHLAAIAAEFWKPIASKSLPDDYVIFDENTQGPRGRYGRWSFAGNGRDYGVGYQGKDTFAGCMLTDPDVRPLPLDAALQVVTTEVRLNHTDNHWKGGRCHSALERLSTALGPDFGSLAVRYQVSKPNWSYERDDLFPWQGTQAWYLSKTRLVGLVALEAMEDETRAAVHGRIRLGLKREIEPAGENAFRYGGLFIRLHDHNYAKTVTKPSETFFLDKPDRYRSTEITLLDPLSVVAGEKGMVRYPEGTRYFFLVEVRAEDSPPAENVERIEREGLWGFRFREPGREVVLLHNPGERAIDAEFEIVPPGAARAAKIALYRGRSGKPKRIDGGLLKTRIDAHGHVVAAAEQ